MCDIIYIENLETNQFAKADITHLTMIDLTSSHRTKEEFMQLLKQVLAIQATKMNSVGFSLDGCLACKEGGSAREDIRELGKNYFGLKSKDCFSLKQEFIRLYPDFSPQGFEPDLVVLGDNDEPTISFKVTRCHIPPPKKLVSH